MMCVVSLLMFSLVLLMCRVLGIGVGIVVKVVGVGVVFS